jgi:hypothetical protein
MSRTLELPDAIYTALEDEARASGVTAADWIASKLPKRARVVSPAEREAANARLWSLGVSGGHPLGANNEAIDADLAREYGSDHADSAEREPRR